MTAASEQSAPDETGISRTLEDMALGSATLANFAFRSFKLNRLIALHPNADVALLTKLAQSPDKPTRRNVALHPQTPRDVLLALAPTFPGEFFLNPAFDLLLLTEPNLLFDLPVGVLKNILKRPDCPDSSLNWAAMHGDKSHQLALVSRPDLSRAHLEQVAGGPHVRPAEVAAGRLLAL